MKSEAVFLVGPGQAEVRTWDVPDPGPHEVQVKCVANGICMGDTALFGGHEPVSYPRPIGHEGVGVVVKVPKEVTHLREGDYVDCYGWSTYQNVNAWRVNKFQVAPPDPTQYLVEPAACVVTALYSYKITPGDRVLLIGAGFMGLLNVQGLARCPLADLVVVDLKPYNLQLAAEYGATEVIHANTPAGTARLEDLRHRQFDLVIEAAAAERAIQDAGQYCRTGGRLSIFSWHHQPRQLDLGLWHMRGLTVLNSAPGIGTDHNTNSFERAVRLLERGVFDMGKLITHRYSVAQAQKALEESLRRPPEYIKGVLTFDN